MTAIVVEATLYLITARTLVWGEHRTVNVPGEIRFPSASTPSVDTPLNTQALLFHVYRLSEIFKTPAGSQGGVYVIPR